MFWARGIGGIARSQSDLLSKFTLCSHDNSGSQGARLCVHAFIIVGAYLHTRNFW